MIRRPMMILVLFLALLPAVSCEKKAPLPMASEAAEGDSAVQLGDFHARPSPAGATVGAIFGTLTAPAGDTLRAVRVLPTVAERAEIHQMVQNADGQMEMRQVPFLALPEDLPVELKPGGMHVMLFGLAAPLEAGRTVRLTLLFQNGGERVIEVPVRED